jgi:hypothetical protein
MIFDVSKGYSVLMFESHTPEVIFSHTIFEGAANAMFRNVGSHRPSLFGLLHP